MVQCQAETEIFYTLIIAEKDRLIVKQQIFQGMLFKLNKHTAQVIFTHPSQLAGGQVGIRQVPRLA